VAADAEARTHVMKLAEVFRARVIDVAPESLILESTGTSDKIAGLLDVLRPFGLLEVARSGHVAMARGTRAGGQIQEAETETETVPDNVSYSV
jgi:acetolactate synthase-1/3 small subunit